MSRLELESAMARHEKEIGLSTEERFAKIPESVERNEASLTRSNVPKYITMHFGGDAEQF